MSKDFSFQDFIGATCILAAFLNHRPGKEDLKCFRGLTLLCLLDWICRKDCVSYQYRSE